VYGGQADDDDLEHDVVLQVVETLARRVHAVAQRLVKHALVEHVQHRLTALLDFMAPLTETTIIT